MKTKEEKELDHILTSVKQQFGDDFLLIVTPDGNGNVAIPTPETTCGNHINFIFDRLSNVLSPSLKRH